MGAGAAGGRSGEGPSAARKKGTMKYGIGDRIGAIRNSDKDTAYIFGYGVYAGDEVPPDDVMGPFGRLGLYRAKNPKLIMDDGTVVWGCECWWGGEDSIRKNIGTRSVELVKPERTPATDVERADAKRAMAEAHAQMEPLVADMKARMESFEKDAK